MPLPLITPVGSNFLKDWPAQNATNCDLFDAAAGRCLTTHTLNTYTPKWTASTTDPVMGINSVQLGYYYLVFDMVFVFVEMRLGTSGALRGLGAYTITLPFKSKAIVREAGGGTLPIGEGQAYSNATPAVRQPALVLLQGPLGSTGLDVVQFALKMGSVGSGRLVTESAPFTFNSSDGIMFSAHYQRDMS